MNICDDIYTLIIEFISVGHYKDFIYSCKKFYNLHSVEQIKRRKLTLYGLYKLLKHKPWHADLLYQHMELNMDNLSFDISSIWANPNIMKYYEYFSPQINWEWFSKNPALTESIINTNIDKFNLLRLSRNSCVNINIVIKHKEKKWDWKYLTINVGIHINDILNNSDLPWVWSHIAANKTITMKIVNDNPHLEWCPRFLSKNMGITMQDVRQNSHIKWNDYFLSHNPNVTVDDILQMNVNWVWDALSHCTKVILGNISNTKAIQWNYSRLASNKHIKPGDVLKLPTIDWNELSSNPNLDYKFVLDHPEDWNWLALSVNPFLGESKHLNVTLTKWSIT